MNFNKLPSRTYPIAPTECRHEVEVLRDLLKLHEAMLDEIDTLVMVLDRQGNLVQCNRAFEQMTGYGFEETLSRPFWELFLSEEERASVRAGFKQLFALQSPIEREENWVSRDGSRSRICWTYTPFLDGENNFQHAIVTGREIAEGQRQEEESLRLQETLESQVQQTAIERLTESERRFLKMEKLGMLKQKK